MFGEKTNDRYTQKEAPASKLDLIIEGVSQRLTPEELALFISLAEKAQLEKLLNDLQKPKSVKPIEVLTISKAAKEARRNKEWLSSDQIRNLHSAVSNIDLDPNVLIEALPKAYASSLPRDPQPNVQLLIHLRRLNKVACLDDDSIPFSAWLGRAIKLSEDHPKERKVFLDALAEIRRLST